jgi:hypothetical protein
MWPGYPWSFSFLDQERTYSDKRFTGLGRESVLLVRQTPEFGVLVALESILMRLEVGSAYTLLPHSRSPEMRRGMIITLEVQTGKNNSCSVNRVQPDLASGMQSFLFDFPKLMTYHPASVRKNLYDARPEVVASAFVPLLHLKLLGFLCIKFQI